MSKVVVKDYVEIFEDQTNADKRIAEKWLYVSLGLLTSIIRSIYIVVCI
jgi:hypothetical protein